jgi:hypothetical protein
MRKEEITYVDYNGTERTETFWFNLSKAEIAEFNFQYDGGLAEYLKSIKDAQSVKEVAQVFKTIIRMSYGEKSLDGRRFVKKAPDGHLLADDFEATEAYSILYMKLATDENAAAAFINGVVPKTDESKTSFANKVAA